MRTLAALARLRDDAIEVVHLGAALDASLEKEARQGMTRDPRYRWLGAVPHARARRWRASSHAMVIRSRMEGGANVVCEALRIGVPVLASRIPGNVGLLGPGYAGYFPAEDDAALARLIHKAAGDAAFYRALARRVASLRRSVAPAAEARALLAALPWS
jgi:glycosyltransferase involved in cell wall biosynthesis